MKKVKKVWGEEHWIVNQDYCGKKLILKKNYRCSLHHHKIKDEVFYIIKGKVLLEADGKKIIMEPGCSFHVKTNCNHRFTGLKDSEIIEFSSHHEDDDSYRQELSGKVKNEFEDRTLEVIDSFKNKKILVIGDIMIDKYIIGKVERISPEAPVQVIHAQKEDIVPGGAANVCTNIVSLGAKAYITGVVGRDKSAQLLFQTCKKKGINTELIIQEKERITTQKQRIIGMNQQLLRIDYETNEKIKKETEKKLIKNIKNKIRLFDAIIISDYAKGVITQDLIDEISKEAKNKKIPLIVDPKPENKIIYNNISLLKPNLKEAIEMSGIEFKNIEDISKIGKKIVRSIDSNVLITCGNKGMYLYKKDGSEEHLPTQAKEVYDVTGAGDTVAAVTSLALASGANLKDASFIANKAAGIVVGKTGTSTTNIKELKDSIEDE
jgi:D-glycero-beta-D-manno-heptose-7-phosphate kinase